MLSRPRRPGALLVVALLLPACAARAEVVHLKNGATIAADAVEERGDDLVIRQGRGTIVVPRADVARIEATPRPSPGAAAPAPAPTAKAAGAPDPARAADAAAARPGPPSREEALQRIDTLERRLREQPLAQAENRRELVSLLLHLGGQAYRARNYDEAVARFRQALGHEPESARGSLGLAAAYAAQGQDIYARSTLERALVHHPGDPDLHALLGEVYYGQERLDEALGEWQTSQRLKPNPALQARIDKLRREQSIDGAYRRSEAIHFTLKYDGEGAPGELGGEIIAALESQFTDLVTRLDHYPRQPIVVIVYPQRQFHEATLTEQSVAGLFDGKIRVPIGGVHRVDRELRATLMHELTHAFVADKSRGTAPRWLHEGLAQIMEGKTASGHGRELAASFRSLPDRSAWGTAFSYPSSLSFVEFLIEREGLYRVVDALEGMGEGLDPDAAFERATRYSLGELRLAWGEALARKHEP